MILEKLLQPLVLNNEVNLKNRFIMAPMTRNLTLNAVPDDELIQYFVARVKGGIGLVITEPIEVAHPSANKNLNSPDFSTQEKIDGWKNVVNAVHENGGKIFAQIWHMGWDRNELESPNPEVRSVSPSKGLQKNYATITEIKEIVAAFGQTAKIAKKIGFDGIEIHGAHGYLIDEFIWKETNYRTDEYGGSIDRRLKFPTEVVEEIRKTVGSNYPISFRLSQWKVQNFKAQIAETPEELKTIVVTLSKAGVDIFHCSTRRFWEPAFKGSNLTLAGWVKKLTGKITITVGSVGLDSVFTDSLLNGKSAKISSFKQLELKFSDNEFDLVALGRSILANPDFVIKVTHGSINELRDFSSEMLTQLK